MSLAGFRKQLNKANQFLSEQMGAAEPTQLDPEYHELERKMDITNELVDELVTKTYEFLQPNPVTRAKMGTNAYLGKIRGAGVPGVPGSKSNAAYPQPEGELGDVMAKHGREFGDESALGRALVDAGESFHQMADVKYALEDTVKQNFLDPLMHLQNKDLKEVAHHRKKLQGRRLDYDCKKRQKEDDMHMAEEKLEESKKLAETAMWNVLESDVEQVSQLLALAHAQLEFHKQNAQILEQLTEKLSMRVDEASSKNNGNHVSKPVLIERSASRSRSPAPGGGGNPFATTPTHQPYQNSSTNPFAAPSYNSQASAPPAPAGPSCRALFDFEPENPGELGMKEGDTITLVSQIDENWYEGRTSAGKTGFFPVNYVQVLVPLPR